jgi:hypothetical protein
MSQQPQPQAQPRPLEQHRKWREDLILQLRMADVPGDRIGDILLEADAHLRETGETPAEAFGNPKEYARLRSEAEQNDEDDPAMLRLLGIAVAAFSGTYLLTSGATEFGKGAETVLLVPPVVALIAGAVILTGLVLWLPVDLICHPTTKQPLFGDSGRWRGIVLGALAILAAVFYLIGRMLA